VSEKLYAQQGNPENPGYSGDQPGADGGAAPNGDGDVFDADYEVVDDDGDEPSN
jgi:hypothetical protein